jgi:uncharacterized protein (DUF58 family)
VLGAGVLWLVLEWYGATSEVPWLFLLAAWIAALVVAAAGYAWWNRAGLRLHLAVQGVQPTPGSPVEELPETVLRRAPYRVPVFEGDRLELEVGLTTRGASRGPASVAGIIDGTQVALGAGLVPKEGWRQVQVLDHVRRGPLGATGWSIGTGDPMGFFRGARPCADTEVTLVLPRFTSLASRRESRELEASVAAPRAGSGNELFGIREYSPGDSLRRIHWRSSARHGELVVREYEPPGMQTLAILLDPAPATREVADQIARIAASEAWDCISQGGRVLVWAPGLEPAQTTRDVWSQLEWLARYPDGPVGPTDLRMSGAELVVITGGADPDLLEGADRAWVVGDAEVTADVPLVRVGLQWPL